MPAHAVSASTTPTATAPDGILIHTFPLPPAGLAGVAEGRIPPGRYGIHRHLTLEQYTYVISGEVTVVTGTPAHPQGVATAARAGELHLALPGESLQFINTAAEVARVLFICAPPYPPDDSDVCSLPEHRPPVTAEVDEAIARLQAMRVALNAKVDARVAALIAARARATTK